MTNRAKLSMGTAMAAAMLAMAPGAVAQTKTTTTTTPTKVTAARPVAPQYRSIRGFYRSIRGFWGDVNPFYRSIRGFWGDVDPFYRSIRGFWGTVDPTTLATTGNSPAWSGVGDFWEQQGAKWIPLSDRWTAAGTYDANRSGYAAVATDLTDLKDHAKQFWGAAVVKQTGKSFEAGFSDAMFARYGINPNSPASLAALPGPEQQAFFLDWYDGLMNFSGTDHVDHWMKTVNWTPRLTQVQGSGAQAVIGLIDQYYAGEADVKNKLLYSGGNVFTPNAETVAVHGGGVLSLINANHDGRGVMGIAPNAKVFGYNPFDASGTADWAGVTEGIRQVGTERELTVDGRKQKLRASVINLSLGAPGSTLAPDWRTVFKASGVDSLKDKVIYVIAAGNDGHRQTANINMKDAFDSTFIVVGSVDPTGRISEFSNTPGEACLTEDSTCKKSASLKESGYLKNRFIVAPGELLLVSDGKGGVTRQSGTSLAAPLVSGAIALIHDRWPWFKDKPRDVAEMILRSARDVGDPGIDGTYGVGILDVEAAQAPLNFGDMKFYLNGATGKGNEVKADTLENTGVQSTWESKNMFFTAFEKVIDEERDFLIPLSSTLYGATRGGEYFQDYVYNRMTAWIAAPSTTTTTDGRRLGISDVSSTGMIDRGNGWSMAMRGRIVQGYADQAGRRRAILNSTVDIAAPEGRFGFSFGQGDGALALAGSTNLGLTSDFDPYAGGTNPLLGFASGGTHLGAQMQLAPQVSIKVGITEQTRSLGLDLYDASANDRIKIAGMERYRANATNIGVDYRPAGWLTLTASATRLAEPNAFLGVRTTAGNAFGEGTVSTGMTVGGDADIGSGVSLFGSATGSRSSSADDDAGIRVRNARGTAFQFGVAKQSLLGNSDTLRLSVARPLSTDRGTIQVTQMEVIDRDTGEQGWVARDFALTGTTRRLVAEGVYAAPIFDGQAELGLFSRSELREVDAGTPRLMMGGQFRLSLR